MLLEGTYGIRINRVLSPGKFIFNPSPAPLQTFVFLLLFISYLEIGAKLNQLLSDQQSAHLAASLPRNSLKGSVRIFLALKIAACINA